MLCVLCLNGYEGKIGGLKQDTDYKKSDSCPTVRRETMRMRARGKAHLL